MGSAETRPLAVVTGASSGIGRELAARFAENGYDLIVAAEDERIGAAASSFAELGIQAVPVRGIFAQLLCSLLQHFDLLAKLGVFRLLLPQDLMDIFHTTPCWQFKEALSAGQR